MRLLINAFVFLVLVVFQSVSVANISPRIYNALNELQQKISAQPDKETANEIKTDLIENKILKL